MGDMLQQLRAVEVYLARSAEALGAGSAEVLSLQQLQVNHLKESWCRQSPTLQESADTLEALTRPSVVTPEHRTVLSRIAASRAGAGAASSVQVKRSNMQVMLHMHDYLTESDWEVVQSKTEKLDNRMLVLVNRSLAIGLTHPSELSVVSLVSLLEVAAHENCTSSESLERINRYKRLTRFTRTSASQATAQVCFTTT